MKTKKNFFKLAHCVKKFLRGLYQTAMRESPNPWRNCFIIDTRSICMLSKFWIVSLFSSFLGNLWYEVSSGLEQVATAHVFRQFLLILMPIIHCSIHAKIKIAYTSHALFMCCVLLWRQIGQCTQLPKMPLWATSLSLKPWIGSEIQSKTYLEIFLLQI